ncbi:MAG TPA: hypothetical protein VEV87_02455 [Chitinophagaceae bacterium]|nr:hypothetical protein [Chitinophagaceae bacterium]
MTRNKNQNDRRSTDSMENVESAKNRISDIKDARRDEEKLRGEETTIDLPEVKDIPGQEHVRPPYIGEMVDSTPSSADEEGEGLLDELNQGEEEEGLIKMGTEADVTPTEVEMLKTGATYYPSKDEDQLTDASMDNVDFDGEPLNEKGFGIATRTSSDLDVPGTEEDDESEEIGAEDEENNEYSLGSQDNDQLEERNT